MICIYLVIISTHFSLSNEQDYDYQTDFKVALSRNFKLQISQRENTGEGGVVFYYQESALYKLVSSLLL